MEKNHAYIDSFSTTPTDRPIFRSHDMFGLETLTCGGNGRRRPTSEMGGLGELAEFAAMSRSSGRCLCMRGIEKLQNVSFLIVKYYCANYTSYINIYNHIHTSIYIYI